MMRKRKGDHDVRFQQHLLEHPEVLSLLTKFSLEAVRGGKRHLSIRWVWERARDGDEDLGGLNDHFHSRYARLLMASLPELNGVFYTRRLRSRDKAA